jgi:DNA-binding Lrp family transcriptional regulator
MHPKFPIDATDRQIVDLLRADARRTVRDIASRVGLTVAPVKRRIDRLEAAGVIEGYTVRINEAKLGVGLEAVVELRVVGDMALNTITSFASEIREVQEVLTIAGDPDALVRVRVDNIHDLQRVVNLLRTGGAVTSTKTLVVLDSWVRR